MWRTKGSRLVECFVRRPGLVLILLPSILLAVLYAVSEDDYDFDVEYLPYKFYNVVEGTVDGYLVWNPKCHVLSKEPLDPSIVKFVKKERFERCSNEPLFTHVFKESNGSNVLSIDPAARALYPDLACCCSPVVRPKVEKPVKESFDSSIAVKPCEEFKAELLLPAEVEVAMVSCKTRAKAGRRPARPVYENVHAIVNVERFRQRAERKPGPAETTLSRKLSVLVLGIDSVSRLNFKRTMPKTDRYLSETGWVEMRGYNKMGDNTFPNLMAILTGQNQSQAYSRCKPTVAYNLDRCPFLWHNFRNAGYATAYGEDETVLNTFNYLKVGFVEPPTEYYLRPYMLASEKLLKVRRRFGLKYCTGPVMSFERIFDYALDFAQSFLGLPYFGFFWMNTISHDNMNGLSSMDGWISKKLMLLRDKGVQNDTMIVFLSDHGMRWGAIRNTFVGWYEERLPFLYLWLPEWARNELPGAEPALRANQNRLTSPFDLYETLRSVLRMSGGEAEPAVGCPRCGSLLEEVPRERGCEEAGVAPHWCTCTAFKPVTVDDATALRGVGKFLEHVEAVVKNYKDKKGRRLCAKLRSKKVHRIDRVIDFAQDNSSSVAYFYMIQTTPGDGKFEVTIRYRGDGQYTVSDDEVSRINPYAISARCLERGMKQYCHCLR
ncbi:hypothetical protein KM043_001802 [Ampulex compressa]|nr:hypothetical protein KM043_001802 [Ampulex compressa]